jgi:hypothetical protein
LGIGLQESKKVGCLDVVYLAEFQNFGSGFVFGSVDRGAEAEDVAGFGDLENNYLAVLRTGRKFHPALAEHINSRRRLALDKQCGALWVSFSNLYVLKARKFFSGELTKEPIAAQITFLTFILYPKIARVFWV